MVDWLQLIIVLVNVCCREGWLVSRDIPKICDSLDYYLGISCGDYPNFTSIWLTNYLLEAERDSKGDSAWFGLGWRKEKGFYSVGLTGVLCYTMCGYVYKV